MKMTFLRLPRMVVSVMVLGLAVMSVVQQLDARTHKPKASKVKVTSYSNSVALEIVNITSTTSCYGESNGLISFSVEGGTAPYTAALSGGATSVSPITDIPMDTTETFSGLAATTSPYFITVTDANGDMVTSGSIVLQPVSQVNITVYSTPPTCFGKNNGSMTVTVSDAVEPATIVLKSCKTKKTVKKITGVSNGVTKKIKGLAAGLYCLTVTDADGCSTSVRVSVLEGKHPLTITVKTYDESCPDDQILLTVKAKGGMAPYIYQLDNGAFQDDDSFCCDKGKHTVTVQDSNGCTKTECVKVS